MALGPMNFSDVGLLQIHAVGGQWGQWISVTLKTLVQFSQTVPSLAPTSLEHTKQYHIDLISTKAATALLKDL